MKRITAIFIFISGTIFSQGTWTQMSNFPGSARTGAVAFSINGKGYMGTGSDAFGTMLKDFWEYDPVTDAWAAKTNFGGTARQYAVGFSIGTKGYIGTGNNTSDFWEYDPSTNAWTMRAAYGGGSMSASVGWGVSSTGKGYLGACGLDALSNFTKKFYEYDQAANTWTAKTQPPFNTSATPYLRMQGVGFAIGTKGYVLSGMGTMASYVKDLYEYDPGTNTWAARASYTAGFGVYNATGFGLGTKGYMVTGEDDAGNTPNFHREYNPSTNAWGTAAPFPGTGRQATTSFTVNGCGYVITGRDNVVGALKEVWRWCPPAVLPIELISFTGKNYGDKNNLYWKTAIENNNSYFTLERGTDGQTFETITTIRAAGNSNHEIAYYYSDLTIGNADLYYYRLRQTDRNQKSSVSGMIAIPVSHKQNTAGIVYDALAGHVKVFYDFDEGGEHTISIYDLAGRKLYEEAIYAEPHSENIHTSILPSFPEGVFITKLSDADGTVLSQNKFVK